MTTFRRNSPSQIQLSSRPSLWLIVFLWLALAAYLLWVMPTDRIRLIRGESQKVEAHIESMLFGLPLHRRVIHEVAKAEVQSPPNRMSRRHGMADDIVINDTARVAMLTPHGWVPVSDAFTAGLQNHQAVADGINRFLVDTRPGTAVFTVPRSGWLSVGLAFLLFAVPGITFGSWCQCVLDRELDRVQLRWASIPRSQRVDYRLSDVERFLVLQTWDARLANNVRATPKHTLIMRLKYGQEVSVTRQYDSGVSAATEDLARRLNQFLAGA